MSIFVTKADIAAFGYGLRRKENGATIHDIKMRPVSHPGTHHKVFQLNLRSHVYSDLSSFWLADPVTCHRYRVNPFITASCYCPMPSPNVNSSPGWPPQP